MLISLTNNLRGSISCPLETSTPFALLLAKVMNEASHLVLIFFLFAIGREAQYWSNLRNKIFHPCASRSSPFRHLPSLLRCLGGRTGTLFCKGKTLEMTTPINLLRCSGANAGILSSQRRLLGPKTDCQFPTNHLNLESLG